MRRRRWFWLVLFLLLLTAVAVAVLVLSLPRLVESALQRELAGAGVESFSLGDTYIGLSGAGTSRVTLEGRSGGWEYRAVLGRVQGNYTLKTLWRGEVTSLEVGDTRIRLTPPPEGADDDETGVLELASILGRIAALKLPVDRIALDRLTLDYRGSPMAVRLLGEGIEADGADRTLTGRLLARPSTAGREFPEIRVSAGPGALAWIPDLEASVIENGASVARANAALRHNEGGNADRFPWRTEVTFRFPRRDLSPFAAYAPILRDHASRTTAQLAVEGQVSLPATIDLQRADWYLRLPLTLSADAAVATALPGEGIPALSADAAFTLSGAADDMVLAFTDELTLNATLAGAHFGLPPQLLDDEGLLTVRGAIAYPEPIALRRGALADVPVGVALELAQPTAALQALSLQARFTVGGDGGTFRLSGREPLEISGLTAPRALEALRLLAGWPVEQPLALGGRTNPEFSLRLDTGAGNLALTQPLVLSLEMGPAEGPLRAEGRMEVTTLELGSGEPSIDVAGTLNLPYRGTTLPEISLGGSGARQGDGWRLDVNAAVPRWKLESRGQLMLGTDVKLNGSLDIDEVPLLMRELKGIVDLPVEMALTGGRAKMDYSVTTGRGEAPDYELTFDIGRLTGILEGTAFNNGALAGGLAVGRKWRTTRPLEIRADQVSAGVVLTGLEASVEMESSDSLSNSRWRLNDFSASLFGGRIGLKEPGVVTWPFSGNRLTFQLSNLSLGEILRLYEEQGVSGEGILNGEVPLVFESDGVRVAAGGLSGQAPGGTLSFDAGDAATAAQTHEQLAMTLRLMEDFQYTDLDVKVHLAPSGEMNLAVSLKGNNPGELDGRPVNLNINLEENIFDLIRVLKLTDELTREIEKRVEQQSFQ